MTESIINLFEKRIDGAINDKAKVMIAVSIGENSLVSETELNDYFYDENFIVLNYGNSSYSFDTNTLDYIDADDCFVFGKLINFYFV